MAGAVDCAARIHGFVRTGVFLFCGDEVVDWILSGEGEEDVRGLDICRLSDEESENGEKGVKTNTHQYE